MISEISDFGRFVRARYGDTIDLGACLVGKNLNLLTVRGFGRLDQLAVVSAPDVYDMIDNPTGTQRALKMEHARDCFDYALKSQEWPAEERPFAFPEVILNARDNNVIEIYDLADPTDLIDLDSYAEELNGTHKLVGLRVLLSQIRFPKPEKAPQISRVDGNHRLYGADLSIERTISDPDEEQLDYPFVPFALFVALKPIEEGSLFRDINAEHKGMETAHLDTLTVRLHTADEMKKDPALLPLWLANELTAPGRAFAGMVFKGGSTRGLKAAQLAPPIKINALKTMIGVQLRSAALIMPRLREQPDALIDLLDRFWTAVKKSFPDAWGNKRDYILLQSIGLNGFAEFGGKILERAWEEEKIDEEDFVRYLKPVVQNMSLNRSDYPGVAGAGGARIIADKLILASTPDAVRQERNLSRLQKMRSLDEKLSGTADGA